MKKLSSILLLAMLALLLALAGCTQPAQNQGATPAPGQGQGAVTIKNFAFNPNTITINAGGTVVWTNQDSTAHQIASDSGDFESETIQPGASYSRTFPAPGTYPYHCVIHPSMKGDLIVE